MYAHSMLHLNGIQCKRVPQSFPCVRAILFYASISKWYTLRTIQNMTVFLFGGNLCAYTLYASVLCLRFCGRVGEDTTDV